MSWWESLDHYLTEREKADADAPDPWGSVELGDRTLTDEQIAYLAFDQPEAPRLRGSHQPDPAAGAPPDSPGE